MHNYSIELIFQAITANEHIRSITKKQTARKESWTKIKF